MRKSPLLVLLASALALFPAGAATVASKTMICPIGGASFEYGAPLSSASLGTRPDGKPYGDGAFPPPLPECPDNGLVLYKDYTAEEVARLEPLIASQAYQALRQGDTQYYRAYWLMREMGLGPEDHLWVLLQASWQAEDRPELRARYQAELAEASAKVEPDPADLNWIGMEARAIDALRQLGRFDEALARLAKVPLQGLDVQVPQGQGADQPAVREARVRRTWLAFFGGLKAAIERKDASVEPFDLIPRSIALGRCIDEADTLAGFSPTFCEREKASVDALKSARARVRQEMEALGRSRDASGR